MSSKPTPKAIAATINGWDEIAIAEHFGATVPEMTSAGDKTRFTRALVFIHERRQGAKDTAAYKTAMDLLTANLGDYFDPDEPDEVDPDDPITESGKDDER